MSGEKVENLVPVAEPPFTIGWFEAKAMVFNELQGGGVGEGLAGREIDGEEVLGAIDHEGGEVGVGVAQRTRGGARAARGGGFGLGRSGGFFRLAEVFRDAAQEGAEPGERFLRGVDVGEERLAFEERDQLAELGAGELKKENRGGRGPKALQGSESG